LLIAFLAHELNKEPAYLVTEYCHSGF